MNVEPYSPICNLKVLKSVPLDSTYKDTLYFGSQPSQTAYFSGKAKYSFTDFTPIRLQNTIRIPKNAEMLYDCNYLMWQNTNFGNRWFYAFITSISYVNQNMCKVGFEIDVMQTWMFDVYIRPSFVEREMIDPTEQPGDNLVPENMELGEYIIDNEPSADPDIPQLRNYCIMVASTLDAAKQPIHGKLYSRVYSGVGYVKFDSTSVGSLNNWLETLINEDRAVDQTSAIIAIFMMHDVFSTPSETGLPTTIAHAVSKHVTTLDGYEPKNKKLFTYPYNFLYVSNNEGGSAVYPYEYFESDNCTFNVSGDVSCSPSVQIAPNSYKGQSVNYDEKLTLSNFPQCSFTTNSFAQWLANNQTSMMLSLVNGSVSAITGAMAGNPLAGVSQIVDTLHNYTMAKAMPPQAHGSFSPALALGMGQKNFDFYNKCIRKEFAEIIDQYFSMYGYATNRVKVPNTSNRPEWNYIKTRDCHAVGSVPFEDIEKIRSIYDSGFTFWHNPDHVGQYNRENK